MKRNCISLCALLLAACSAVFAQSSRWTSSLVNSEDNAGSGAAQAAPSVAIKTGVLPPLSRVSFGAGVSPLGVGLQASTNLNQHMNLRATGNILKINENNISTNGFNIDADLNLASAGASLDFYPWSRHGFRLSPGVLFYNQNGGTGTFTAQAGTSFTLNDFTYYASSTNPVTGVGTLGLHSQNPAFTITTGWGNTIPRNGGHWSFPFELGIALIGSPAVNVALNSGQVCDSNGLNCVNVASDPTVQANLQAQVDKYRNDLDPLKTYPIVSIGVAYSFRIR
jgi:hypothetical protein